MGAALQRIGQPAVMGQLIAGILLGPSVFGAIWPEAQRAVFAANPQQKSMIDGVSQLGILMLLLLTGMETDLRLVKQAGRAAISASIAGIAVPFACGFALGELLPAAMLPKPDQQIITSLFLGTALSIASLKIVAMHHGQPPRSSRSSPTGSIRTSLPDRPNQVWLADITYVPTSEGWLYLAVVLDLFTRKIVGWAMRDHMRAELTIAALTMAIQRQNPPPGLIHHSDRGSQYRCR